MDGDDETAAIVEMKAEDSISQPQQLMIIDDDDSKIDDIDSVIIESEHQKSKESTKVQPQRSMLADEEQQTQQPPIKPAFLPDPSPEQRNIIRAVVREGKCVSIRACAGSGKTTCMLQVAASLPQTRQALIVTYNRSLADECKERISRLRLGHRVKCYTIHGLVSRFSGRVCNDDHKLMKQLDRWSNDNGSGIDETNTTTALKMDLVMIDEAQDLRPLFYKVLSHVFSNSPRECNNNNNNIQLCLVGDPKQMLYDFPTYGADKASTSFFLEPQTHWGKFTKDRTWVHLPLSVSYRLTPHMASFCNLFWGTSMVGGNTTSPNRPVEYLIKYPYPETRRGEENPEKLQTSMLARLIDEHGPQNVMFLAQSVRREDLPIRVHVNELIQKKDPRNGLPKYNFHIKENVRGFEGTPDWNNKVRVWTFCGSKGCEADVVVVFGLDVFGNRPHALNQIGVALSRARKRLIVVHGKKFEAKRLLTMPYYPVLGDTPNGMDQHVVRFGSHDNSKEETIHLRVPALEPTNPQQTLTKRCELTKESLVRLAESGVIVLDDGSQQNASQMPTAAGLNQGQAAKNQVYIATDFNYFSALAESKFLKYGTWEKAGSDNVINTTHDPTEEEESGFWEGERVDYQTNVRFANTTEDVSALYGEAVVYMLQWERCRFVPNIETVVSNGILSLHPHVKYSEEEIRESLRNMCCEALTPKDDETLSNEFPDQKSRIKGQDLISFINSRLSIQKKIRRVGNNESPKEIVFPVVARERQASNDDNQLTEFLPQMRSLYESASTKKPFHWIYLANAVMAFSSYHEKFRQIGTDPASYESWVDAEALLCGLGRLQNLMNEVSPSDRNSENDIVISKAGNSSFERELSFEFAKDDFITEENNQRTIVGVTGVCDWVNENRTQNVETDTNGGTDNVDLLEIKFVHHLSNAHRLQVLVYTALYALKVNNVNMKKHKDADTILSIFGDDQGSNDSEDELNNVKDEIEWKVESCRGMLYNARTGEKEFCTIQSRNAMDFLLDISQFKYNGKDRNDIQQERRSVVPKKENHSEQNTVRPKKEIHLEHQRYKAPTSDLSSFRKRKMPKKRLAQNTGTSYYTAVRIDDQDKNDDDSPNVKSFNGYSLKKRRKQCSAKMSGGTDDDPIIID